MCRGVARESSGGSGRISPLLLVLELPRAPNGTREYNFTSMPRQGAGVDRGCFPLPGNHLLRSAICLFVACSARGARRKNEHVRSEAKRVWRGKGN